MSKFKFDDEIEMEPFLRERSLVKLEKLMVNQLSQLGIKYESDMTLSVLDRIGMMNAALVDKMTKDGIQF
jgi:hypothetical protein